MNPLILSVLVSLLLFPTVMPAQQTDRDLYVNHYRSRQYEKAILVLKRITKQNSSDGDAWYYLGLSYLEIGKEKDAVKALEKAVANKPNDANSRASLAYAFLLRNDDRAATFANEALKLSPKNVDAHYVLGVRSIRDGLYNAAYERAKKVVEIDPNHAPAYLLKTQALVSSFSIQSGTVIRPRGSRGEMLQEAVSDLEKYISLRPNSEDIEYHRNYLDSLKFFSEYYGRPENQAPLDLDPKPETDVRKTPLKILANPRAQYTDRARNAGISGTVRLLVGFATDGKIKHILVVKSLGYGLDEQSIRAAKQIKFQSATKDGKPVSSVKTMEYSFAIY